MAVHVPRARLPRRVPDPSARQSEAAAHTMPATNPAVSVRHFCYRPDMTIGITGPGPNPPRRSALAGLIIAAIVGGFCLVLLGRASDVLVDWLWLSSIGYLPVFLT